MGPEMGHGMALQWQHRSGAGLRLWSWDHTKEEEAEFTGLWSKKKALEGPIVYATDDGLIRGSNRGRPLAKYVRVCEHEFSPKLQVKVMPRYVPGVKAAVCAKNCLKAASELTADSLIQPGV